MIILTDKEVPKEWRKPLELRITDINKDREILKLRGRFLDSESFNMEEW